MSYHSSSGSQITSTSVTTVDTATMTAVTTTSEGSSNIFAYWANEGEDSRYPQDANPNYFPNWELLGPEARPFSFVQVEVGKQYVVENLFSEYEGFNVALWYHDSRDAAYGLMPNEEDGWIQGPHVMRGTAEIIEPQARYLFAGTFGHNIQVGEPSIQGYELKGSISEVQSDAETPVIEPDDLFMIQHDGDLYRIAANSLKDYFAGLAVGEDLIDNNFGKPGLMFPGSGLTFDSVTGKVDAVIPARPRFAGLITAKDELPGVFALLGADSKHPFADPTLVKYPLGDEQEGDYYVVYDTDFELTEAWGYASGTKVYRGDSLIRVRHGDSPGDFEIIPCVEGATSLQTLLAPQYAIDIDGTNIQFPVINIKTSKAVAEDPDYVAGYDGFLSKEDKDVINKLPVTYTNTDFDQYPQITD